MATARELLQQELQRRSRQSQVDDNAIREDISEKQAMAEIDPSLRRSMRGQAAFMDYLNDGKSNLAGAVQDPTTVEQAINQSHAAQRGTPKQNLLGYLQAQMGAENADARVSAMRERGARARGRELSANDVMKVQEGENIPMMLKDVDNVINENASIFGPVEGRVRQFNPYDTRSKTVEAQMRAASQAFGRYMEGGVLRKEDEDKYRRMFPSLSDTPSLAKNKLGVVSRLMQQRQAGNISALSGAGFDTSIFASGQQSQQPQAQPQINNGHSQDGNTFDVSTMDDASLAAEIKRLKAIGN